ncbi:precorrin-6y C5,15-methyltransferase (decarboxylating) subunit CbiE [Flavobacterium sp. ZT3R18]|uniref:precorrin-6y C5,15-methyltransferase (decarboxylating) subunit CbiE n=1 Tax=Flavobacterium sp. ZT3R18 TaxID=2594429 RepID=UPI00117AE957|nr:precorrin-6y C5,15-methyltransferase (decarboxylating) subunit CbiE [Flavobacterium sp. ZT3R18]TRX32203.1 precorrin-6y C5,15-methyltransferase (decarboxylating) subunit CbiE [Flavobacterium sp. ZT3R18]
MNYILIGISDNPNFVFSDETQLLLQSHQVFSGGKRHYELVQKHLPENHQWITISGEMSVLFEIYKQQNQTVMVFASGDPLFYGFANTIQKFHPEATVKTIPYFNSIQLLCHKAGVTYSNITYASVHGRSWRELDVALMGQKECIGVLTDAYKSPQAIAKRALDYGYKNYQMIVGESLEGNDEKISRLTLAEAIQQEYQPLNCVLLIKEEQKTKPFGIPDSDFEGLPNRPNMITKMPIRLLSLSQLDLHNRKTLWDIGFCTGSISIEAQLQFPHLDVLAFEIRPECESILENNARKFGALGIQTVMGDFFLQNLDELPQPDTVFIGGHGNRLAALIAKIDSYLLPKGRIVINAVKQESKTEFIQSIKQLDYELLLPTTIKIDQHNEVTILTAQKR